jgi:hypothetical protein
LTFKIAKYAKNIRKVIAQNKHFAASGLLISATGF